MPFGIKSFIELKLPDFLQGFKTEWKLDGKGWQVISNLGNSLEVIPGKSKALVTVAITDLFLEKTYQYEQIFKGINSKQYDKWYLQPLQQPGIIPNPASHEVQIYYPDKKINKIDIYDMTGRLVKSVQPQSQNATLISLSDLHSGLYMISLLHDSGQVLEKLVVEK